MSKIYIIRSAPYEYKVKGMDLYDSFDAVAQDKVNVSLKPNAIEYYQKILPPEVYKSNNVYCSNRSHSLYSAQLISKRFKQCLLLNEIEYKMSDIVSKNKFLSLAKKNKINVARKIFFKKLVRNELPETFDKIIDRISRLENKLLSFKSNQSVVCITHGFFMKTLELFIRDPDIKSKYDKLLEYYDGSYESFKFGEGFEIEPINGKLVITKEIRLKKE